ncbi:MAG TPA: serine/threonine-protein kinase [Drouetiella sp.]
MSDNEKSKVVAESVSLPEQFEILETLGQGGMGIVYKARNRFTRKVVAIKVLLAGADDLIMQRFQREAQAACALEHPNVVQTYDFGMLDGTPYIVMEYVHGDTLDSRLKFRGRLDFEDALPMFKQVASGVARAHSSYIVHRDLKPSNIIFSCDEFGNETAKIFDFGIAKVDVAMNNNLTQTGEIFGTPLYMSPEQLKGAQVDARSDIYSLGAVMYQTIVGEPPHTGDTVFSTMFKKLNERPKTFAEHGIKAPAALERIIFKCLEVEPRDRYREASEIVSELDRFQNAKTAQKAAQKVYDASHSVRSMSSDKKSKVKVTVISVLCGITLCAGLAFGFTQYQAYDSAHKAERLENETSEQIAGLMTRSDATFAAKDYQQAFELAVQAKALADKSSAKIATPVRVAAILERLIECERNRFNPISELSYVNQLIPIRAKLDDSGLLEEEVLNRRLQLIGTIAKNATELEQRVSHNVDEDGNPLNAVRRRSLHAKACRMYQAIWDCLAPSANADSKVRIKVIETTEPFLRAIQALDDPADTDSYYNAILKLIPQLPKATIGQAYYYVGAHWLDLAINFSDASSPAGQRNKYLSTAEKYFLLTLQANKDLPEHIFTLSAFEGLTNVNIEKRNFKEAKSYLDKVSQLVHDPLHPPVDDAHYKIEKDLQQRYKIGLQAYEEAATKDKNVGTK